MADEIIPPDPPRAVPPTGVATAPLPEPISAGGELAQLLKCTERKCGRGDAQQLHRQIVLDAAAIRRTYQAAWAGAGAQPVSAADCYAQALRSDYQTQHHEDHVLRYCLLARAGLERNRTALQQRALGHYLAKADHYDLVLAAFIPEDLRDLGRGGSTSPWKDSGDRTGALLRPAPTT